MLDRAPSSLLEQPQFIMARISQDIVHICLRFWSMYSKQDCSTQLLQIPYLYKCVLSHLDL